MKRYETYKPSGVEWLGEIPENWQVKRLKDISTKVGDGLHGTPNYTDDSTYYFINGNNLQNGVIDFQNARTISQDVFNEIKISFNSQTLFLSINGTIGNLSFYNNEKIAIGKSIAYIILKSVFNKNFLFYHMLTDNILDSFEIELSGTTIKNLSLKTLRETFLINPTFSEQTTIANYLDTKTTAIDRKIELLTAKADKYKALRRSLINETVCRGVNTNVPQKDSGIEWIGMIPEHWKVDRLKNLCKYISRGITPDYAECSEFKVINQATFSQGIFDDENIKFTTKSDKRAEAIVNDIIVASTGGGVLGKVYFINSLSGKYYPDSHVTTIRTNSNYLIPKYLYYYLSISFELINGIMAKGSTNQTELQRDSLLGFNWCVPPINEQKEIVDYLDTITTQIDTILTNISEKINKLSKLRKTLINDVVTGKIKVTE
jgi:type I restriction enzyme, S subunit